MDTNKATLVSTGGGGEQEFSFIPSSYKIAVLVPCYNEEATVTAVVSDFKKYLPHAEIYVYDNNSTDNTAALAKEAGAIVRREPIKGKGAVVRRMFSDIEADVYIMVDGDATYNACDAPLLAGMLVRDNLDMVVACRKSDDAKSAYRAGHVIGNKMLTGCVRGLFGAGVSDMLSGYRAFSRRFVKSFPCLSQGFEIETEITVHTLNLKLPFGEISSSYGARPEGSQSKLSTYKDGLRILGTIFKLLKTYKPLELFGLISLVLLTLSLLLGIPIVTAWLATGLVPKVPTAILSTGLIILSMLFMITGIILGTVSHQQQELKRLIYLSFHAPSEITS